MQTNLNEAARQLPGAAVAERVMRACVHCGFCNATCPTYQLLGNELDGPRGRIYLMKQMFETGEVSERTRTHLDRCLTCRNCETTCPSGVEYHKLLDIGRAAIEKLAPRTLGQRLRNRVLRTVLPNAGTFRVATATARWVRPLLPEALASKIPASVRPAGEVPRRPQARKMLILQGCVQPSLSPNTNAAAMRVLDRLGIQVTVAAEAGCCGAVDYHLNAQEAGLAKARRNIDAWWPHIEAGAEAIIQTASGCGAFVKEYGELLRDDPVYANRARRVSDLAKDLVEVLSREALETLGIRAERRLAFHCPCTLQHAQKLGGAVETVLKRFGFTLAPVAEGHLCCGSAGTYSITQPELSQRLRDRKLDALEAGHPEVIATANIGCQMHLESAGRTSVRHWIELVDAAMH